MQAYTLKKIEAIIIVLLVALTAGFVYYIGDANIKSLVIFGVSGLAVMVYYFFEFWIHMNDRPRLIDYLLFDNPAHTYEAVKRLAILCAGAGVLDHMSMMTLEQIVTAGASCGYLAFKTHKREVI